MTIGQVGLHEQVERQLGLRMQAGLREHAVRSNPQRLPFLGNTCLYFTIYTVLSQNRGFIKISLHA